MKTTEKQSFNFGVLDYNKTLDNHTAKLSKYRKLCNETPELRFNFTWDQEVSYTPPQYATKILNMLGFVSTSTRRNVRTRVNGYFYHQIVNYLNNANLPASWATAVYLDCYDELNEFMEVVAEVVWVRIK